MREHATVEAPITYVQVVLNNGHNSYTGSTANEEVFGLFGDDNLYGGGGQDYLHGDFNDDRLYGEAGDDILDGGTGDDTLEGGAGADIMIGDVGNDTFVVKSNADGNGDIASGGLGIDTLDFTFTNTSQAITFVAADPASANSLMGLIAFDGIERYVIHGQAMADRMTGYRLDDRFYGGAGNDALFGMDGDDDLYGEAGIDTLNGGSGNDYLDGGDHNDKLYGGYGNDSLYGEAGNDYLDGGENDDYLQGGDNNDQLFGGNGDDSLNGGTGDDTLNSGAGDNTLYGGLGADIIAASSGDDTIYSDGSWDGAALIDRISAGAGNDSVTIGVKDIANGGDGIDKVYMTFDNYGYAENFVLTAGTITLAAGGSITGFEILDFDGGRGADKVTGAGYNDTLDGGDGNDILRGSGGDDRINGQEGDDALYGGGGNDYLTESNGADRLYGEDGNDTFYLGNFTGGPNVVDGGADIDRVVFDSLFGSGSAYVDLTDQTLNNGRAANTTFRGIEIFEGTYYDDIFIGSSAHETLIGGGGGDILVGNAGNDRLVGGTGSDAMAGGAGNDIFDLSDLTGSPFEWEGDQFLDFTSGQDKIRMYGAALGFNPGQVRLVSGPDAAPVVAAPTLLFDSETSRLWWDQDGTSNVFQPVLVATLDNVTKLVATDFIIV
jgi:Ca2+-binding RTX toxin-like protein